MRHRNEALARRRALGQKDVVTAPDWIVARPIAHRALHDRAAGRPENTPAAAEAAVAAGFTIECDVQLTADGEAVVFHDHELERLTGEPGDVRGITAQALGQRSVLGSAEHPATLAAFLDGIGGRVPVVVEVKSRFDGDERLLRRTVAILGGRSERIAVKSFDPALVALLRRIAPTLPRGIVAQSSYAGRETAHLDAGAKHAMANLLHWDETAPDFVSWHHGDLPAAAPFFGRHLGRPVMTWTIRSPAEAARARAHADQIVFEGFVPD